jgi:hypothetical protein
MSTSDPYAPAPLADIDPATSVVICVQRALDSQSGPPDELACEGRAPGRERDHQRSQLLRIERACVFPPLLR